MQRSSIWSSERLVRVVLATAMLAALWAANLAGASGAFSVTRATAAASCADGDPTAWQRQIDDYAAAGAYHAVQANVDGRASTVLIEIPAIAFTGEGRSATLPVGPCQYIYRYQYSEIEAPPDAARPFAYVEVDWNTEGEPRGPNGSFVSPHFDFHFYLLPRDAIEQLACVSSNGKTCDALLTHYAQMRPFLYLPDSALVPDEYRPDVDSSIPAMGLHLLDVTIDYTVETVNHYPTLIYGTFDGEIVFAEASVTLYTLQDAVAAPDHRITFPFRQPAAFEREIDWPTEFVIEYLPASGGFRVGFAGFAHQASPKNWRNFLR